MLHEILLSLSGVPSPIWTELRNSSEDELPKDSLISRTTQAERSMLKTLGELVDLHIKVRENAGLITRSHPSPTCRATSTRIHRKHLQDFTAKIVQVETSVLQDDAAYVGAYRTVPLSTIVSEFEPWIRPFRFMWKVVSLLQTPNCSAAHLMSVLRKESYTGYGDIKALADDLLIASQQAWMQSLSPWLLYGQLPSFGPSDFLVHSSNAENADSFILERDRVPYFVTSEAAETVLAVGKALNQIKLQAAQSTAAINNVCATLLPSSLEQLNSLKFPLEANQFGHAVDNINQSISQTALATLLPLDLITELLLVAREYILLANGEFSLSLIKQAEHSLRTHQELQQALLPVRKLGRTNDLELKTGEISAILDRTWLELASLVPDHQFDDPVRANAATWLRLRAAPTALPVSTLLPSDVALHFELPIDSPLHIFITTADTEKYGKINAYLVSMRRSVAQLEKLWKISSHRRCYPPPPGPPISSTPSGRHQTKAKRARTEQRDRKLRPHWSCAHQALFVLSELNSYLHGEVIHNSWTRLQLWLEEGVASRPTSSHMSSRPTTATTRTSNNHFTGTPSSSVKESQSQHIRRRDPRTIARAHKQFLDTLYHSLLLQNPDYLSLLKALLTAIDHLVALFIRLPTIWQGLDLREDEGINNALSDHSKDEADVLMEMKRTTAFITEQLHELVAAIREADRQRDIAEMTTGVAALGHRSSADDVFEPWKARTLDRLLMKLDFLDHGRDEDGSGDVLLDGEDD